MASINMEYGSSCCVINSESTQFFQPIWLMLPERDAALAQNHGIAINTAFDSHH